MIAKNLRSPAVPAGFPFPQYDHPPEIQKQNLLLKKQGSGRRLGHNLRPRTIPLISCHIFSVAVPLPMELTEFIYSHALPYKGFSFVKNSS
jgi:hypothetical protein